MADENVSEIKVDYDKICEQLSDLVINDDDFKILSQEMDVYCPFEALGVARLEIRHSNFLADILKPLNPHGFGDHILKKVTETLLTEVGKKELALDLHLSDLSNVEIRREWEKIDLLLRFPNFDNSKDLIIAIEIKVESSESDGQLKKYENAVNQEWSDVNANKIFIFLTPEGGNSKEQGDWKPVGFDSVIDAMEDAMKEEQGVPEARMMVRRYIDMVRRRYVNNNKFDEIANKIWSKHSDALEFLFERRTAGFDNIKKNFQGKSFLDEISGALQDKGCVVHFEFHKQKSKRYIWFTIKEWDKYTDLKSIYAEIDIAQRGCFSRLVLGPVSDDIENRARVNNYLKERVPNITKSNDIKYSTLFLRTICDAETLGDTVGKKDELQISELKNEIIQFFVEIIPPVNIVIMQAVQDGEIK